MRQERRVGTSKVKEEFLKELSSKNIEVTPGSSLDSLVDAFTYHIYMWHGDLMDEEDDKDLPKGDKNQKLPPVPEPEPKSEKDLQRDFFFPKKKSEGWGKCECGLDASGSDGKHSTWCPKYKP